MDRNIFEDEHEMFRDAARSFYKNEVLPHGERWREQGIVDREAFLKAGEQGMLLMWADEKYGGSGVHDFRYEQILVEEIAKYGEPGFFMTLHSRLAGPYIGELGTDEQKERWLPKCVSGETILAVAITEAGAGSDVSGVRTKAEDKGDHYLLNGSKTFISNGILADLVVVVARTDSSRHGLSLFVVERGMEGFERGKNLKKMGLKSQDTAELFFQDVRLPASALLGAPESVHLHDPLRAVACGGAFEVLQQALILPERRRDVLQPVGSHELEVAELISHCWLNDRDVLFILH